MGWFQFAPPLLENWSAALPTPSVNGQVVSSPALQSSMSMLSFAPATSRLWWFGSIATAGSFCLFPLNGLVLPTVTSASAPCAAAGTCVRANAATKGRPTRAARIFDLIPHLLAESADLPSTYDFGPEWAIRLSP